MNTIKRKSSGANVKLFQQFLIDKGFLAEGEADGVFGSKTEDAVKLFQTDCGLKADGIVGPKTIQAAVDKGFQQPQSLWDILYNKNASEYKELFYAAKNYLKTKEGGKFYRDYPRFSESPKHINCFAFRCNGIGIPNDVLIDNDIMVITINNEDGIPDTKVICACTVDPKTKRYRIAFACEQQYYGNLRNHRGQDNRIAVCQDNHEVWVRRYLEDLVNYIHVEGKFGINWHNVWANTSEGCICHSDAVYRRTIKPLWDKVKQFQKDIPCTIIHEDTFYKLK